MKMLLWLALLLAAVAGVVVPVGYFVVAGGLPQVETEFELEKHLRLFAEGERVSHLAGLPDPNALKAVPYQKPEFARLPKDLVALYLSQLGCPGYFQAAKSEGLGWKWTWLAWALWNANLQGNSPGGMDSNDAYCERFFAVSLAHAVGARGRSPTAILAHQIHGFLQKDRLVAYHLSVLTFDRAVVGLDDASNALFKKPVASLELAELAEMTLALPPNGFFEDIRTCRNASLIRRARDLVLEQLVSDALVPEDSARQAKARPVACLRP